MNFIERRKAMLALDKYLFQSDPYRFSGRTTGNAFSTLGRAMENPKKTIPIRDHNGNRQAFLNLFQYIVDIIDTLGLEGFKLNKQHFSITYDPGLLPIGANMTDGTNQNPELRELVAFRLRPVIVKDDEGRLYEIINPEWGGYRAVLLGTGESALLNDRSRKYVLIKKEEV